MDLPLPDNLVEDAALRGPPGRREWLAALPTAVEEISQRWSLSEVGQPYQPGGTCSWVAPARDASGRDVVLKVGWRHPESEHEAAALQLWNGAGAVVVHEAHTWGNTSALLLERCVPGVLLKVGVPEPEQDAVVAGLLHRLWVAPNDVHAFTPLEDMCDQWVTGFEEKLATASRAMDPGIARAAAELFRTLPARAGRRVVLCTDLHAENILSAQREQWLAIDPKPYVGDPTYDALQHMLNCEQRLIDDPRTLAKRLAELLHLDVERLLLWLFARCAIESLDRPLLRDVAARLVPG